MNLAIFEDAGWRDLLPLTWIRPAFDLRCGRWTFAERIERVLGRASALFTRPALRALVAEAPLAPAGPGDWRLVNGRAFLPENFQPPQPGTAWMAQDTLIAATLSAGVWAAHPPEDLSDPQRLQAWLEQARLRVETGPGGWRLISRPWELALWNADALRADLREAGGSGRVYPGAHVLNSSAVYVGPDAVVKPGAVLDAEDGPIHLDAGALVQPSAVIEGPAYVGPGGQVRPGATIRPNTTLGPGCRVGGEISCSVFQGHSNKQHEGFVGHSYVGEWVNLGAGTTTSNLKNTYGTVRLKVPGGTVETGEQFVGSLIGDHAKTGIGVMLPTGCVIGPLANVFTRGPVPAYVPPRTWLGDDGPSVFHVEKAVEIAKTVMARRGVKLSPAQQALLENVSSAGWPEA